MIQLALLIIALLAAAAFVMGSARAKALAAGNLASLHSRPVYHGAYGAISNIDAKALPMAR